MAATSRFAIPLLDSGQAQKEVTHNEALALIDALAGACVEQRALGVPPGSPALGRCYIVASGASGAWAGKVDQIAVATEGGWRFIAPREGLRAVVASEAIDAVYRGTGWIYGDLRGSVVTIGGNQVVGGRGAAIPDPAGGTTVDSQSRATLASLLATLRTHGLIAN